MRKKVLAWMANFVRVITLLWLVVHFSLTMAYVMPPNPVNVALQPLLNLTIGTYFPQNWKLFAPNPISMDLALMVRPLSDAEVAKTKATRTKNWWPTDGWYDLSAPLWVNFQQNRFSAYDRLSRPAANAILMYLSGNTDLQPWLDACQKGDSHACAFYNDQLKQARLHAVVLLEKIASAFCKDIGQEKDSYMALQIRQKLSVPWSERYISKQPNIQYTLIGIYPIDRNIDNAGFYSNK